MGLFNFFKKKQSTFQHAVPSTPIPHGLNLPPVLHPYWDQLAKTASTYIRITAKPNKNLGLSQSSFGSIPLLPKGYAYPKDSKGDPMFPLAQINLAEMPPLEGYPQKGLLQFYIADNDVYGLAFGEPHQGPGFTVFYFEEWDADNAQTDLPFPADKQWEGAPVFRPMGLTFSKETGYVSASDVRFEDLVGHDVYGFLKQFGEAEEEAEEALYNTFETIGHRMGGYIYTTQEDPRQEGHEDWLLLLQIDSQDDGIMWGDVGVAHFFIHPDHLRRCDFSKVYYSWDCT
jgi:uncharacterized protein YwqG